MPNRTDNYRDYLGDGLYTSYACGQIRLAANNGMQDYAVVYLEPEVWQALLKWKENLDNTLDGQAEAERDHEVEL